MRVSRGICLIMHRTPRSLLLCYVGHHDDAYRWAECRKIETHPRTGAAQIVEIRETVKHSTAPQYVAPKQDKLAPHWFENVAVAPNWWDGTPRKQADSHLQWKLSYRRGWQIVRSNDQANQLTCFS